VSVVRRILPSPEPGEESFVSDLLRSEVLGGLLALTAALVALLWANSPWDASYRSFVHHEIGPLDVEHWGADGALSLFFFVAGLEVKREFVVGSLSRVADALVPVAAALCGVAVPALLYLVVNVTAPSGHPGGWAIPAATDIAFALAVLAVVGSHLPPALRAFLLTLAVVDDLVVITIIALVFTDQVHVLDLTLTLAMAGVWALLQWRRVSFWPLYLVVALVGWWFMHESGVHATIEGVLLGLLTRVRRDPGEAHSPAETFEHHLAPISTLVAVPFFALVSAGVPLDAGIDIVTSPIAIGVFVGLVLGKPIGVLGGTYLVTRFTHAELNEDLTWRQMVGVAALAGIGFTVSLLVAELSFAGVDRDVAKAAVLAASVVAAFLGAAILRRPVRN